MEKPEVVKRGAKAKYPWVELVNAGDYFVLPYADKSTARSVRAASVFQNLKVSVKELQSGGYIVELLGRL